MEPPKTDFISAPIGRTMIRTAVPMLAGTLAMSGYNIADTYFIGKLGALPLAAVGFTLPVVMLAGCVFHGMGTGVMTLLSHALGEKRHDKAALLTTSGLLLTILVTIVLALTGIFCMRPVFRLLGADAALLPMIKEYMLVWYVGAPTAVIGMVGNSVLITAADSKWASAMMILGMLINVFLDPLLIFGWGPIPGTGIFGGALATVLSQAVSAAAVLILIAKRHHLITRLPWKRSVYLTTWLNVFRVAIPSILGMLLMPIGSAVITKIVSGFGHIAVAGASAAGRLEGVAFLIPMALGMSMMPMIGQNYGAKRFDRINQCRRFAVRFAFFYELGLAVIICAFAPFFASLFCQNEPEVAGVMTQYLRIIPWGFGLLEIHRYSSMTFTGCNRPAASAWLSALRIAGCLVPFTMIAALWNSMPLIFAARLAADVISGLIAMYCAHRLTWRLLKENSAK